MKKIPHAASGRMDTARRRVAPAGLAGALLLACAFAPRPAQAEVWLSTSGGGACKPAYGASNKFTFTELYAQNIGTTDQYLVCSFANFSVGPSQSAQPVSEFRVWIGAGATPGTAVCTVKMGFWIGSPTIASQSTKSVDLEANQTMGLQWYGSDLPRTGEYHVLSMNCKIPGGAKLGLIQRFEPEPVPGTGWTPPT